MEKQSGFMSQKSPIFSGSLLDAKELHISECSSSSSGSNAADEQENIKHTNSGVNIQRSHNWSKIFASAGLKPLATCRANSNSQEHHISDCTDSDSSACSEEKQQENRPSFISSRKRRPRQIANKIALSVRQPLSPCKLNNKQLEKKEFTGIHQHLHSPGRRPSSTSCPSDNVEFEEISIDSTTPKGSPQHCNNNAPTELDMLVELIQSNNYAQSNKNLYHKKPAKRKQKRCTKGGYVEQFRNTLLNERMNQRFLAHERQMNITSGITLSVNEVCVFFSIHMAKVDVIEIENTINNIPSFYVILNKDIASQIHVGSRLEAFLDAPPIHLDVKVIFFQPHKLILL